ncbi:hypothetical protein [Shewanella sp.]|uniref:hypothetical protein n=1 Tax=Shewanella sp. TaxID=50422 RepID=UPI003562A10C
MKTVRLVRKCPSGHLVLYLCTLWPAATNVVAAGHEYKTTKQQKQTPGFRLKSIAGMTQYLTRAGWKLSILFQTKFEHSGVGEAPRP